jgi:hypothetical protein
MIIYLANATFYLAFAMANFFGDHVIRTCFKLTISMFGYATFTFFDSLLGSICRFHFAFLFSFTILSFIEFQLGKRGGGGV